MQGDYLGVFVENRSAIQAEKYRFLTSTISTHVRARSKLDKPTGQQDTGESTQIIKDGGNGLYYVRIPSTSVRTFTLKP
jgi:hypothetical protein